MQIRAEEKNVCLKVKKNNCFSKYSRFKSTVSVYSVMYSHLGDTPAHRLLHLPAYHLFVLFFNVGCVTTACPESFYCLLCTYHM